MIVYKCLVNGSIAEPQRQQVRAGLERINQTRLGIAPDQLSVEFTEVAPGLWFTAGEPSQASMVLGSVPAGTSQTLRIELMDEVARMFSEITGADYHQVMVVAADRPAQG